jgi:hypothetical protein
MNELIKYILVMFITFLGFFIGTVISNLAKEEIKPGKKYFKILKTILIPIMFYVMIIKYVGYGVSLIPTVIILLFAYSLNYKLESFYTDVILSIFLSILFVESLNTTMSILILMYSMFSAGYLFNIKFKLIDNLKIIYTRYLFYPIITLFLLFYTMK